MNKRKKILFIQPDISPPGGGQAVAVWMLQALKDNYDITLFIWESPDIVEINRYYGTSLQDTDLTIKVMPAYIRYLIDSIPNDPWHFHRWGCLMRRCNMFCHQYDIVMSANNETDFGIKGIQYVHYPYLEDNWAREVHLNQQSHWYSNFFAFAETHLLPWRIISGFSFHRMKQNLTLINSQWTGQYFQKTYDARSSVLYPPATGTFPEIPWKDRHNGFVCISRISSEKRIIEIIDVLAKLRNEFPDVHLHIIGSKVQYDDIYYQRVKQHAEQYTSWVFLEENISRSKLEKLVSEHRYGIHGMENEHFGIAVAEMVRAGCITFVPDSGGQVEIIGDEPRLLYRTEAEVVTNIRHIMQDPEEQSRLRKYLQTRKELFSTDRFTQQISHIVADFLSKNTLNT